MIFLSSKAPASAWPRILLRTDPGLGRGLHAILRARRRAYFCRPLQCRFWRRACSGTRACASLSRAARTLKLEGRTLRFQLSAQLGLPETLHPDSRIGSARLALQSASSIGLVRVDDMPALLASADIVVLPSYREGLPKSLIEAAACIARPLVTADAPGCRDVVTDGVDGLLVPVRDVLALAQAIARLEDDRPLARRLGQAARGKALAQYDERCIVARTLDVYYELLGEPPTGANLL